MATAPILKLPIEILQHILHAVILGIKARDRGALKLHCLFELFEEYCIKLSSVCSRFRTVLAPTAVLCQWLTEQIASAKHLHAQLLRQKGKLCLQLPNERD